MFLLFKLNVPVKIPGIERFIYRSGVKYIGIYYGIDLKCTTKKRIPESFIFIQHGQTGARRLKNK